MKTSELRNLIREEIKRALREAAGTEYDHSEYLNPPVNDAVVKDVMKELKKLSPKLLKATRNDFSFTTFNLPSGPEVRVSVDVVTDPNEEAGTIKTPRFGTRSAVLMSDEKMDVRLHSLRVSERTKNEYYHLTVTVFKAKK